MRNCGMSEATAKISSVLRTFVVLDSPKKYIRDEARFQC